ncbi:relaxase/mobilization nuclease domain-containing protein [Marinobacterium rhizophilum]|uniref:relaxase/mobilization nuclease domain-containing protein n=1 Tax=Marinobacterium rhizophilum TaxID=420402 RepID=UPI0003A7E159|nr:relaxase/mobilization nuclease domain-containing protein [Marinobacterium rhizophilum]
MIVNCQRLPAAVNVAGKTAYILNPEAHKHDPAYRPGERIGLVDTEHVMPVQTGVHHDCAAELFARELERWCLDKRGDRPAPAEVAVDLALSFSDRDELTPEQALFLARELMADVMPGEAPTLYAVHTDSNCLHVHIIKCTVDATGRIWNPHRDYRLWEAACDRIEDRYGLVKPDQRIATQGRPQTKAPTAGEWQKAMRTGEPSTRMLMQAILKDALAGCPDPQTFAARLSVSGLKMNPTLQPDGQCRAVVFSLDGKAMKGSDLGRAFTGGRIMAAIGYVPGNPGHVSILKTMKDEFIQEQHHGTDARHPKPGAGPDRITHPGTDAEDRIERAAGTRRNPRDPDPSGQLGSGHYESPVEVDRHAARRDSECEPAQYPDSVSDIGTAGRGGVSPEPAGRTAVTEYQTAPPEAASGPESTDSGAYTTESAMAASDDLPAHGTHGVDSDRSGLASAPVALPGMDCGGTVASGAATTDPLTVGAQQVSEHETGYARDKRLGAIHKRAAQKNEADLQAAQAVLEANKKQRRAPVALPPFLYEDEPTVRHGGLTGKTLK